MKPVRLLVALAVGLVAASLVYPWSGADSDPPQCLSVYGYTAPCHAGYAVLAALVGVAIVLLVFWLGDRGQSRAGAAP